MWMVAAARIAGSSVIFSVDSLRENDRALGTKLLNQDVVARRKIDIVGRIATSGGAHVLGVERVLEGKYHTVHRQLQQIRVRAVLGIQCGGALQGIGLLAEHLTHRRRARRQRPLRGVTIEITSTGDGTLAADVERAEGVDLTGIGHSDDHAELLMHRGIGYRALHPAEFQWRAGVFVEIRQDRRRLHRLRRKPDRRLAADDARHLGHRFAVLGNQHAADTVVGPDAVDIVLNNGNAVGPAVTDRAVQVVDRRFLETERFNSLRLHQAILFGVFGD